MIAYILGGFSIILVVTNLLVAFEYYDVKADKEVAERVNADLLAKLEQYLDAEATDRAFRSLQDRAEQDRLKQQRQEWNRAGEQPVRPGVTLR